MNIEQLKYIVVIARTGSLKQAADELHLTLPALSQSIKSLESELNITLFHRSRRGSVPTEEGHKLIEKAKYVLLAYQDFIDEAEAYTNTMSGEIRVATYPGPMGILVEVISKLKMDYPDIKTAVYENSTEAIIKKVQDGEVDVGLITYNEKEEHKYRTLIFNKLLDGHMVAAINKNSQLTKYSQITEEMLKGQPIILYDDIYISDFMKRFNLPALDIRLITNNIDTIKNSLENNTAINIGFDYAFKTDVGLSKSSEFVIVDFAPPLNNTYAFGYIYHKNNGLSRIIREFIKRMSNKLRTNPPDKRID